MTMSNRKSNNEFSGGEKTMYSIRSLTAVLCTLALLSPAPAVAASPSGTKAPTQAANSATELLLKKARSLEGRGRLDLAAQTWKQVLMTEPGQAEALAGLARWAKQNGRMEESKSYVEQLRRVNPNDGAITRVESMKTMGAQQRRLDEASSLARQKRYSEAMAIYRDVFGNEPPPGGWAVAYYETEAATEGGWERAKAGLQRMVAEYPNADEYKVSLGRLLTYRPEHRAAGMKLLESVGAGSSHGAKAQRDWRQALIWEGKNPAALPSLRAYLARYKDAELEKLLASMPAAEAPKAQGPVYTAEENAGYEALNGGQLPAAEAKFESVLKKNDASGPALAGLGFVRMKQQRFADAEQMFVRALQAAPQQKGVKEALADAHFWKTMQEGARAAEEERFQDAATSYTAAMAMREGSLDAVRGLAGAQWKLGRFQEAAGSFERLIQANAHDQEAWRGLIHVRYNAAGSKSALQLVNTAPAEVRAALEKDMDYLALMAAATSETGKEKEADVYLKKATELARSRNEDLPAAILLQIAGANLKQGRASIAAQYYHQASQADAHNIVAWEGLIAAQLQQDNLQAAFETMSRMPQDIYRQGLTRPGFLRSAAIAHAKFGRVEVAEALLAETVRREGMDKAPAGLQVQLADIWLQQGQAVEAEKLLADVVQRHPMESEAWRMWILAMHKNGRAAEALAASKRMPPLVAAQLNGDSGYISLLASLHSTAGSAEEALKLVRQTESRLQAKSTQIPADLLLQHGWLLLNSQGDEKELYAVLSALGERKELSEAQQRGFTEMWSVWTRRRAGEAHKSGDLTRAAAILEATSRLLPADNQILRSLAGLYMESGDHKRALSVYKSWGLKDATPADYAGAIGAAMTVRDSLANKWLMDGTQKWPKDPQLLNLAGQMAAAKGDFHRAEMYYKAALSASVVSEVKEQQQALVTEASEDPRRKLGRLLLNEDVAAESPAAAMAISRPMGAQERKPFVLGASAATQPLPSPDREVRKLLSKQEAVLTAMIEPSPVLPARGIGEVPAASSAPMASALVEENKRTKSQSDEIAERLQALSSRNAPYFDVSSSVQNRSGQDGFEKRMLTETEITTSTVLGESMRVSLVARPTTIETKGGDGSAPYRFGLMPEGASFDAMSASGLGAEVQMSTQNFGMRLGASPQGFLVKNYVGGLRFRPGGGPLQFTINRDNVKDSFLSFAGTRDPITKQVWGGVVANHFGVQGNWGTAQSGFYVGAGYQTITGRGVATNKRFDGNVGAYWRVLQLEEGSLTLGLNVTAMSYEKNLRYFTAGHGGYFSPQRFYIFNVPVHWKGVYNKRFHYNLNASLGSQHFREDSSPMFPTMPLVQNFGGGYYNAYTSTGASYSIDFSGLYQLTPNWFLGGFVNINNARYFTSQNAGVTLKYSFKKIPMGSAFDAQTVPDWRGNQPFMPR